MNSKLMTGCRFCLKGEQKLIAFNAIVPIQKMLTKILKFKFPDYENALYPEEICAMCLEKMEISYKFVKNFEKSSKKLHKLLLELVPNSQYLDYPEHPKSNTFSDSLSSLLFENQIEAYRESFQTHKAETAGIDKHVQTNALPNKFNKEIQTETETQCDTIINSSDNLVVPEFVGASTSTISEKETETINPITENTDANCELVLSSITASNIKCICGTKFISKVKLDDHFLTHTYPFKCLVCASNCKEGSSLPEVRNLIDLFHHIKRHKKKAARKLHKQEHGESMANVKYESNNNLQNYPSKTVQYMCRICFKKLSNEDDLASHLQMHKDISKLPFQNIYNSHKLTKKSSLLSISKKKSLSNSLNFVCKLCHEQFHSSLLFKKHARLHSNTKIYCTSCKKYFKSFGAKNSHVCEENGNSNRKQEIQFGDTHDEKRNGRISQNHSLAENEKNIVTFDEPTSRVPVLPKSDAVPKPSQGFYRLAYPSAPKYVWDTSTKTHRQKCTKTVPEMIFSTDEESSASRVTTSTTLKDEQQWE